MNREQREQLTRQTTQEVIVYASQPNAEERIYTSLFNSYSLEMSRGGREDSEQFISEKLAQLPIPILVTRNIPEISVGDDLLAYHWQALDRDGDEFTFDRALAAALEYYQKKLRQIIEGLFEIAEPGNVKNSLWQAYQSTQQTQ